MNAGKYYDIVFERGFEEVATVYQHVARLVLECGSIYLVPIAKDTTMRAHRD